MGRRQRRNNRSSHGKKEYEIEKICGEKGDKVLVQWVGFPDATWEPRAAIPTIVYQKYRQTLENPKREYEIEKVCDEKGEKVLVKWVGYPDATWEPKKAIPNHVYQKYHNEKTRKLPNDRREAVKTVLKSSVKQKKQHKKVDTLRDQRKRQSVEKPGTRPSLKRRKLSFASAEENDLSFESASEQSSDSEEYEVEAVCDESEGNLLVRWVGCDKQTWEPKARIPKVFYQRYLDSKSKLSIRNCSICKEQENGNRQCLSCKRPVHHMCSIELIDKLGQEETDQCFCSKSCYEIQIGNALTSNTRQIVANTTKSNASNALVATPNSKNGLVTKTNTSKSLVATPNSKNGLVTKTNTSKSQSKTNLVVELNQGMQSDEILIGKVVAFSPDKEDWMSTRLYDGVGTLFLTGIVTRQKKNGNGKLIDDQYEIRWTESIYQSSQHVHILTKKKVLEGITNYERMMKTKLGLESWDVLCKNFNESGNPSDLWDEFEEVESAFMRYETNHTLPVDLKEVEKMKSMDFRLDAYMSAPSDLFSHPDGSTETRLKEDKKILFEHSASSAFFAFLPLSFWRKVVENTNIYASNWKQPAITLHEIMAFLGILFYMTTVDKGEYANYWGDQVENNMFGDTSVGLDRVMSLARFKFIRKCLCFRSGVTPEALKNDPAARIRPLINMLKLRSPVHVELGRNVAVDETSIASRSKYARKIIVYNATKPTGKYHFKIYMCCCSTTWFAVNFKLHCSSTIEERLSGVMNQDDVQAHKLATENSTEVRKHVLEATLPIHHTQRIVNTDNFYTSCQLLEALRIKGLYGRGTIRENSKFGPKAFMLHKQDKLPRGTLRQGVDIKHKIIGASWADGSMVNILSNADDASVTTVIRRVGNTKMSFTSPTCISEYNKAMQGVDRIDQLRSRFSIADGHTFKKWHTKLAMAFIDIARCNAFICRKLSSATIDARDPHRQFVFELSSQLINGEWESAPGDIGLLFSAPTSLNSRSHVTLSPRAASPSRIAVECTMTASKQIFPNSRARRECAVCRFEGRYPSEQTVYCSTHNVSVCPSIRLNPVDLPFHCPAKDITCWAKFHTFYFPAGLFNASGNIRRSNTLFKSKKIHDSRSKPPRLQSISETNTYDEPQVSGGQTELTTAVQSTTSTPAGTDYYPTTSTSISTDYDESSTPVSVDFYLESPQDNYSTETSFEYASPQVVEEINGSTVQPTTDSVEEIIEATSVQVQPTLESPEVEAQFECASCQVEENSACSNSRSEVPTRSTSYASSPEEEVLFVDYQKGDAISSDTSFDYGP